MGLIQHDCEDLIDLFNECFEYSHQTQLMRGGDEPLYLPKDSSYPYHRILFANGFFSSALHEIAHWLIAGKRRRGHIDYGYWYMPDGRTADQQVLFEQVEIKPQALEWVLSEAAGYQFHFSFDNLNGSMNNSLFFKEAVERQAADYRSRSLWTRAEKFRNQLKVFYQTL